MQIVNYGFTCQRRKPWYTGTDRGGISVDTRVAIISIIVENAEAVEELNALLHEYARYVIGRMGIPYHAKGINIISVAVDAPMDSINTLAGKLGRLHGVTAKAIYSAK